MDKGPVIVSACLLGLRTRYDGSASLSPEAAALVEGRAIVPVCPEQLGGLPTPRTPAGITSGDGRAVLDGEARVVDDNGEDVTARFLKGAAETLRIALLTGASEAFLKEKSPSCGSSIICRDGRCEPGMGVTAALLSREGIAIKGF